MDTYNAAFWSDPSYSSSDEEEVCYTMHVLALPRTVRDGGRPYAPLGTVKTK
jgi:hypothetical protein